ncbi:hypothetical protein BJ508DRAFT_364052 [Ascobolus immersus RN42]|uniref:Uncharacterized protein n=1 Tax=Ascobolus immersus RN42 TaxID=1160509 RepID=A0A3N4HW51_ASCIM|nr:hypothetical protein BJ508DRAFT_364052 [Ascobolus immersus RN42]
MKFRNPFHRPPHSPSFAFLRPPSHILFELALHTSIYAANYDTELDGTTTLEAMGYHPDDIHLPRGTRVNPVTLDLITRQLEQIAIDARRPPQGSEIESDPADCWGGGQMVPHELGSDAYWEPHSRTGHDSYDGELEVDYSNGPEQSSDDSEQWQHSTTPTTPRVQLEDASRARYHPDLYALHPRFSFESSSADSRESLDIDSDFEDPLFWRMVPVRSVPMSWIRDLRTSQTWNGNMALRDRSSSDQEMQVQEAGNRDVLRISRSPSRSSSSFEEELERVDYESSTTGIGQHSEDDSTGEIEIAYDRGEIPLSEYGSNHLPLEEPLGHDLGASMREYSREHDYASEDNYEGVEGAGMEQTTIDTGNPDLQPGGEGRVTVQAGALRRAVGCMEERVRRSWKHMRM